MYKIINRFSKQVINHTGNWPSGYLEELLNKGEDIIVISLYSNTIKVPFLSDKYTDDKGNPEWEWKDYHLPL